VVLIATGGTISMKIDAESGGAVPRLTGAEILEAVPGVDEVARLEVREFGRYPGPHMTIDRMWELRRAILDAIAEGGVDGVVVMHGTDTIEERRTSSTAPCRPGSGGHHGGDEELQRAVVGRPRQPDERGGGRRQPGGARAWHHGGDGRGDRAGRRSGEDAHRGGGTFRSPNWGPLGITDKGRVLFYRESRRKPPLEPESPVTLVDLVKVVAGMDSRLVEASLDSGAHGIVLEAMGRGNVPPAVVPGVRRWVEAGRPVVVASRSARGRVLDTYAYPGGGHELREMGAIFADHMTGQQSRIELMLALGTYGGDLARVREVVEAGRYAP
jgi:L-asparaginase